MVDQSDRWGEVRAFTRAYVGMRSNQPLTLTVEQAAAVLGVGRSTAYELVRSGDLPGLRLRRRIVIPVATLADRLGVPMAEIRAAMQPPPRVPGRHREQRPPRAVEPRHF